jgi:hypothetical protein
MEEKTCALDYNVTPDVISAPSFLTREKEKQEGSEERDRQREREREREQ